jgi:hypothetical protein
MVSGCVVIAESTRKLVGKLFELEDLGAQDLKGYSRSREGLGGATAFFSRAPLRGSARWRTD